MADPWCLPPDDLMLTPREVHVWRIGLWSEQTTRAMSVLRLSRTERATAERFREDADRRRYAMSHSALRSILGSYARAEPTDITFSSTPYGKPYLVGPRSAVDLRFNLSHSRDLVLLAVSRRREVGVDVEAIQPIDGLDRLARLILTPVEQEAFGAAPPEHRLVTFLRYWTAKEAYLKGCGDGIAERVGAFDVYLHPGQPIRLLRVRDRAGDEDRWSLSELPVGDGYLSALAVESVGSWRLSTWEWQDDPATA